MRPAQTLMEVIRALVVLATVATALHVMVCKYVITVQFELMYTTLMKRRAINSHNI